jgi:hypothetical protein
MTGYESHDACIAAEIAARGAQDPANQFIWVGIGTFAILPNTALLKQNLAGGAFQLQYDLSFEIRLAPFIGLCVQSPSAIRIATAQDLQLALQQTDIQYQNGNYKVESVQIRPGGLDLTINANASGKGV